MFKTGSVRGKEQVNNQRNLLSHDVRHRHAKRSVRLRRRHRRHHCQQPPRLWPVLSIVRTLKVLFKGH